MYSHVIFFKYPTIFSLKKIERAIMNEGEGGGLGASKLYKLLFKRHKNLPVKAKELFLREKYGFL